MKIEEVEEALQDAILSAAKDAKEMLDRGVGDPDARGWSNARAETAHVLAQALALVRG